MGVIPDQESDLSIEEQVMSNNRIRIINEEERRDLVDAINNLKW